MRYYLGLGSNLGEREENLRRSLKLIEERKIGEVILRSHLYETEPVGDKNQRWFLNAVVMIESELKPEGMMRELLAIEKELGRERITFKKNLPRTIDLDILLVDDRIIKGEDLIIPHPRIKERRFVLVPLIEIAGGLKDPESGRFFKEILAELKDDKKVNMLDEIV